jgi:hypothetical protein
MPRTTLLDTLFIEDGEGAGRRVGRKTANVVHQTAVETPTTFGVTFYAIPERRLPQIALPACRDADKKLQSYSAFFCVFCGR